MISYRRWSVLSVTVTAVGALALAAGPAAAAYNDSFGVNTWGLPGNACGSVDFVDNGTWPSGSTNDDYVVVHDWCSDGHGVKAWAWKNGVLLGSKYNGNGLAGAPVYWDPVGNVLPDDTVGLKVCLVDGSADPTPSNCESAERMSVDG
ncbi:hypothetical protein GCM10018793_68390 [Streptomyces sulfonofaciens]|uniref:Secreted protein n=1 Tax=Streptomyces sulfonofaciens TaxID=68272 RepID=A0A919GQG9_9ACTN|nr:hypothetical protein [Streptomyces sulfonofaciens]GHH88499.1 hypothetical protein GCM10018793_68390 [Streptomyces sulfonofaciens]